MKALRFEGSGLEYFKIWIVNVLLTIVTLGLYYPWAKVRNARYFYANSKLEDRNFEYHATGKQLFIGYLISMGLFIAYVIIQQASPTGGIIVLLIFFLAIPWIIWRSLKFNMRVTSFSNVRFGFDGGLGLAYLNYLVFPILFFLSLYIAPIAVAVMAPSLKTGVGPLMGIGIILSLALAFYLFAYIKKRNTHYAVNGFRYGQGQFSTKVETKPFAYILLKTLVLTILLMILLVIVIGLFASMSGVASQALELSGKLDDPEAMNQALSGGMAAMIGLLYLGFIVISMALFAYSYARQRKYIFANSKLDDKIKFASSLRALPLAWVVISNFIIVVFTLGLALPWARVRVTRLIMENTLVDTRVGFDEYLTQRQSEQSSLGEQIGDAFDIDVGLGI